ANNATAARKGDIPDNICLLLALSLSTNRQAGDCALSQHPTNQFRMLNTPNLQQPLNQAIGRCCCPYLRLIVSIWEHKRASSNPLRGKNLNDSLLQRAKERFLIGGGGDQLRQGIEVGCALLARKRCCGMCLDRGRQVADYQRRCQQSE